MRAAIFLFLALDQFFPNILLWKNLENFLLYPEEATPRKSFTCHVTLIAGSAFNLLVDSFQEILCVKS